jgi:hypothetical protein
MQIAGLDRNNVSEQSFEQIKDFANNRLKFAWEYDAWPELIRITRFPVVHEGTINYIVIPNDGVVTNSEGTFKVSVGDVMNVSVEDPRAKGKVREIGFSLDEYDMLVPNQANPNVYTTVRRIIVDNVNSSELFVTYRIECPDLSGKLWKTGDVYHPGQVAYWAYLNNSYFAPVNSSYYKNLKGNFWKCINQTIYSPNNQANTAPANGDDWEKVKIPLIFGQYIIKGIHADWLKSEMQIEFGKAMDADAQNLLDSEVHKIIVQQGQSPRLKFNQIY